jgi:PKD repeat protein
MKRTLLSVLGMAILCLSVQAQSNTFDPTNARDGETVEYCVMHKKRAEMMLNPAAVASFAQDEIIRQKEAQNPINQTKATVWYVPIVFHVLHNGGSENISDEQILDAMEVLNRDYRRLNADADNVHPDFTGMPSDVEIEFVLATKAPNGTCFSGITRTQNSLSNDGSDGWAQVNAIINGNDVYNGQWPGDEYCNVFVCGEIGGAAGYTTTPSNWIGNAMNNGIWILHNYLGSIGTSSTQTSRTLTHETGHWLNLEHVWGPNNNPGNAASCSDDDGVNDTPNEIGVTTCNLNEATCGPRANVENYMDYSYCSKMFTQGQVNRMRSALNSSVAGRNNLKTASNLAATGADGNLYLCNAEFSSDKTSICAGDQIQFTDESINVVTGWTWTFTGGNPASSTSQDPVVTYDTPGLYEVTLSATDGPNTDTETKTAYVRVLPSPSIVPIMEGFEGFTTLSNIEEWEVINEGGNASWELTTATGLNSANSARLLNNNQAIGTIDELVSAPVDLSGITGSMTLSFRYAYKRKNSSDDDYFRVRVTSDCGDSWATRKTLHGFQLTSQTQSSSFTPSSEADWTTVHMTNITSSYWTENFRYLFQFEAGGGNNMYLDNINIYQGAPSDDLVIGISENEGASDLSVYPNPVEGELNVRFALNSAENAVIEIQDIAGKVTQRNSIQANAGANLVFVDTKDLAAGMYFLRVNIGNTQQTVQFVVK